MEVSQGFESGAIEVIACDGARADLAIRRDVTARRRSRRVPAVVSFSRQRRGEMLAQSCESSMQVLLPIRTDGATTARSQAGTGAIGSEFLHAMTGKF